MKQKLSKDQINDAINIISEYESPEVFFSAELLKKSIESHFDAEVDIEDVKPFIRTPCYDSIDHYLTLKNIGL